MGISKHTFTVASKWHIYIIMKVLSEVLNVLLDTTGNDKTQWQIHVWWVTHQCVFVIDLLLTPDSEQIRTAQEQREPSWHKYWSYELLDVSKQSSSRAFHVSMCDRGVRVWRRPAEHHAEWNIKEYDRYGCRFLMFWVGIFFGARFHPDAK